MSKEEYRKPTDEESTDVEINGTSSIEGVI
jgi:hypothetical protein